MFLPIRAYILYLALALWPEKFWNLSGQLLIPFHQW